MNLIEISIASIDRSPYQMRRHFDPEEIEGLSTSILRYGLLHPLLVRPKGEGKFELISGERRLRALTKLKKTKCPVLIRKGEEEAVTAEIALTENLQRVDLTPIEVALSYQSLMKSFSLTQEELATRLGKNRSTVANYLRLLNLPLTIQSALEAGEISTGHAKALLSHQGEAQEKLFNEILLKELPVRKAERTSTEKDPNLASLEEQLTLQFGMDVELTSSKKGGTLTFKWKDLDELDTLLETFGIFSHG